MPPSSTWTVLKILQWSIEYLKKNGIENPRADAEILLAYLFNYKRIDLYLRHDQPLNRDELSRYRELIKKRLSREPVAYITGNKEFWSLNFKVSPEVLIPRPETECMVESALRIFPPNSKCKILEVGCGSGAISIALAHERPAQKYWVSDISIPTLRIAQENMKRHVAGRSLFTWAGDWFKPIRKIGVFDLIISNPPYIKTKEIETLSVEIKNHEPHIALDGGPDGLRAIEKLIAEAPDYIAPGGYLMLEIGFDQGHCVKKIAKATEKYERIDVKKDYSGLDRVMILKKKAC